MKQAVIAPSMLYLLYPLQGDVKGYSREEFVGDLVAEVKFCFPRTHPLGCGEIDALWVMRFGLADEVTISARRISGVALRQGPRGCRLISLKVGLARDV